MQNPDFFTFGGDDNFSGADPGIFDWGVEGGGVQTLVQKGLVEPFCGKLPYLFD